MDTPAASVQLLEIDLLRLTVVQLELQLAQLQVQHLQQRREVLLRETLLGYVPAEDVALYTVELGTGRIQRRTGPHGA